MTRAEAEEIFLAVVTAEDTVAVEMSPEECNVFRVMIGRVLKEMNVKNKGLWLRAREYGIEYIHPYAVVRKRDSNRFKMFRMVDGKMVPFVVTADNESMSKIDDAEERGENDGLGNDGREG